MVRVQCSGFRVWGLGFGVNGHLGGFGVEDSAAFGFRVQSSGFRVQGSGFRVQGLGFSVQCSVLRVQSPGFRVQGSRFRV